MVWYASDPGLFDAVTCLNCHDNLHRAVSGGFAIVHPNNSLTINAVEAAPLEDFSPEVCRLFSRLSLPSK